MTISGGKLQYMRVHCNADKTYLQSTICANNGYQNVFIYLLYFVCGKWNEFLLWLSLYSLEALHYIECIVHFKCRLHHRDVYNNTFSTVYVDQQYATLYVFEA